MRNGQRDVPVRFGIEEVERTENPRRVRRASPDRHITAIVGYAFQNEPAFIEGPEVVAVVRDGPDHATVRRLHDDRVGRRAVPHVVSPVRRPYDAVERRRLDGARAYVDGDVPPTHLVDLELMG